MSATTYTTPQLAAVLALSERAVRDRLGDRAADEARDARGRAVRSWRVESLPADMRMELEATEQRHGLRLPQLVEDPPQRFQPPVAWEKIPARFRAEAEKFCEALAHVLSMPPGKERTNIATIRFRQTFGHTVKPARLEYVMDRAIDRDNGFHEWNLAALYLDERAFATRKPDRLMVRRRASHAALDEVIEHLENRLAPTEDDRADVFHHAFERFETLLKERPTDERAIKTSLIDYLFHKLPALSKTTTALREVFRVTLIKWQENGRTHDAILSRRRINSGNHRRQDFSEDLRKIAKMAVQLGGDESGAHDLLRERGELSTEYCAARPHDPRVNKSVMNEADRRKITPLVNAALVEARGPKAAALDSPHIVRLWDAVQPLDWFVADDVTWNHYFKVRRPDGTWDVMRGECLVMLDAKTDYPLDFLLIAGNYNSAHIRQLVLKVHDRFGLPHAGYYFERGVWAARFIDGDKTKGWESAHWRNTENGLNDPRIGVQIKHAVTARAKTIEGWFNHAQRRMQLIPGYVGRDERHDRHEAIQLLIAQARRARRDDDPALKHFATQDEILVEYRKVIEEFMHRPSNGDRIPGRTPAEVVREALDRKALRTLSLTERVVLASHQKIASLHPRKGVVVKMPGFKRAFCFCNQETGKLVEQGETQVRCYINFERADVLIVENMKGTHRFQVRGQIADAMEATGEHLAELGQARREHLAPARALFGEIKHDARTTITRENTDDDATQALGQLHNASVAARSTEETALAREIRQLRNLAAEAGRKLPPDLSSARIRAGLRMELEGQLSENRGVQLTEGDA